MFGTLPITTCFYRVKNMEVVCIAVMPMQVDQLTSLSRPRFPSSTTSFSIKQPWLGIRADKNELGASMKIPTFLIPSYSLLAAPHIFLHSEDVPSSLTLSFDSFAG